ncbi:murein peptide amidase A [Ilyomonas limi]|uniref:Murein peptide amidase A n=1 Tax=Ilyomonas limi TaxID=2575867 RepID=A0A4U3L1Y5_9BACT|nr:murein peptide amidase A [Ilyomonas limi]TKK68224.1 murein peptide amidase A [Ilyomonas limi]
MRKIVILLLMTVALSAAANISTNSSEISANKDDAPTGENSIPANTNSVLSGSSLVIKNMLQSTTPVKAVLAYTRQLRPLDIHYFPGISNENALVIGGVHGSELSSVSVAKQLIELLSKGDVKPYYNVIIIPSLFPDNAALAATYKNEIGSTSNIGRYSDAFHPDPNRQMPPFGKAFNEDEPVDFAGRSIEMENQLLLQVIQLFRPSRIANVHAIRDKNRAGIYADPRTDCNGIAQGFEQDSTLAVNIAQYICRHNGCAPGNQLANSYTALYYCDPAIAPVGTKQPRNIHGSWLAGNRGYGVSLGGWASTAVCEDDTLLSRPAMTLLTVEFPGNKRPEDYDMASEKEACAHNVMQYAKALQAVFLMAE